MIQAEERVKHLFGVSIESHIAAADLLPQLIVKASQRLVASLLNDNKILLCGNGGSAANCLHFSLALLHHYEVERPPLPVIALTTDLGSITGIAQEGCYDQVFARQIHALGQSGDVLLLLAAADHSDSLLNAIHIAHDRGMDIILLTGADGGVLTNHLGPEDIEIRVPQDNAALIHQTHLVILQCFCDLIDQSLFGQLLET